MTTVTTKAKPATKAPTQAPTRRRGIMLTRFGRKTDVTALFRRIPDDIVLAAATDDLELENGHQCLVAWVVREQLAYAMNGGGLRAVSETAAKLMPSAETASELLDPNYDTGGIQPTTLAAELFGGTWAEWQDVFYGVAEEPEKVAPIELAWTLRVDEAVRHSLR